MGEGELVGLGGLVVLILLILLKAPIGIAMILVGIGGNYILSLFLPYLSFEAYIKQFKSLLWTNMASYDLSAIALFVMMGFLSSKVKLAQDLFQSANVFLGRFKGGVAMANIVACGGFGAICGSSVATTSTMGKIAFSELKKLNYNLRLSYGSIAAGGTLGILIPPSIPLVIYAIIAETSIVEMFQAAIVPGILAVFLFILIVFIQIKINPNLAPNTKVTSKEEKN